MNEHEQQPQQQQQPVTTRTRRRSWSQTLPPMRLTRPALRPKRPVASSTSQAANLFAPAPRFLRPLRALVGLALLGVAWAGMLAVALYIENLWDYLPRHFDSYRVALYAFEALGAGWVGVLAVGCLITGAFSLTLAITSRGWQ